MLARNLVSNSSLTALCTITRSVDMQICPEFRNAPSAHWSAARSRSASSHTMAGALPPSSSSTGLSCSPASLPMMRPTCVEPVKLIFLMCSLAMSLLVMAAALAGSWTIMLSTPAGRPASAKTEQMPQCVLGLSSLALKTAVLPAAMGKMTERDPRMYGAFL